MDKIAKLYEMQDRHQDVWEHFKSCDLCKTNPSHPSLVCPEMRRLRLGEHEVMKELWQNQKTASSVN